MRGLFAYNGPCDVYRSVTPPITPHLIRPNPYNVASMSLRLLIGLLTVASVTIALSVQESFAAEDADSRDKIDFNRDIRQILSDNCFLCHGPAKSTREAGLRLDDRDAAIDSGAIVPGDADSSELVARLFSDDPDMLMPPPESNKKLTARQRERLRNWIEQGAEYERHWAFVTPEKSVDKIPGNPVDHFVSKRLQELEWSISPQAEPRTLIRRVNLDLTGLPPTPGQVREFLRDVDQRGLDAAYERVVDRLLASPAYGERMTLSWLDAARYGDTSVMHADGPRDMWPWRDWVIDAYNANMPFDQFTIEQLAGDLIPEATVEQRIASGFNRNHATSDEGGAFAEELRVEYVVDRVATTSKVWLGLTMECAQCHDHKYDPISQEEYYQFFAYFNNTADPGMQTRQGNQSPVVEVVTDQRRMKLERLEQRIKDRSDALEKYVSGTAHDFQAWAAKATAEAADSERPSKTVSGLIHWFPLEDVANESLKNEVTGSVATVERGILQTGDRDGSTSLKLDGNTQFVCNDDSTNLKHDQPFALVAWIKYDGKSSGAVFSRMDVSDDYRGYDLWIQGGSVGSHIIHKWSENAIKVVSKTKLKPNTWQHVVVTYDGSMKADGVKIYIDGELSGNLVEADSLSATIETTTPFRIGSRSSGANWKGEVDDVRIYARALEPNEVPHAKGHLIEAILATPQTDRSAEQKKALRQYYLANFDTMYQTLRKQLDEASQQLSETEAVRLTSMIMSDNPPEKMRMTYVLDRGQYDSPQKDSPVSVGVPSALPELPKDAPANRLGLAHWLTDPNHPLTARVAVNRYWTMLFGNGLVRTASDFGAQGSPPTHPELLDWLAVDFVESGWDVKRMLKLLVMSQTYRQSSRREAKHAEQDPENLLLARSPRFRLHGEFIRDSALSIAGLLVEELGGPGVKPYQPANIWNEVSLNGGLRYKRDSGAKLYRRSLYTYWKRSAPMPNMLIFDVPSREKCVVKRARTNTPLQALVTLNDPQFVEAGRAFAARLIQSESDPRQRIDLAYRLATARPASAREIDVLTRILRRQRERFAETPESAEQFLAVGQWQPDGSIAPLEHAAWTVIAQMILNLDETLTRN